MSGRCRRRLVPPVPSCYCIQPSGGVVSRASMKLPPDIIKSLHIEPWQVERRRPLERYMDEFGEQALRAMLAEGKRRHTCCWEPIEEQHTLGCPKRKEEEVAPPSQEEALW